PSGGRGSLSRWLGQQLSRSGPERRWRGIGRTDTARSRRVRTACAAELDPGAVSVDAGDAFPDEAGPGPEACGPEPDRGEADQGARRSGPDVVGIIGQCLGD